MMRRRPVKSKLNLSQVALLYSVSVFELSSVHGVRQLAARHRHPIELIIWIGALGCGILGTTWLCLSRWHRYQENPTVISMEKNYQEWNTSFPAATVCPTSKIEYDDALDLASQLWKNNQEEGMHFLEKLANGTYSTLGDLPNDSHLSPDKFLTTLFAISLNFSYVLSNSNSEMSLLTPTMTEFGLCYSYNSAVAMYNEPRYWLSNNWTIEHNYQIFHGSPLDGDIFAQIMDMNTGYKVFIHGPTEAIDATSKYQVSEEKHYKALELTALSTYSTDAVRGLKVSQRRCRFLEESDLPNSPVYSYNFCRMNCRMTLAVSLCGCVPYFYRPLDGNKVCGYEGMQCITNNKELLTRLRVEEGKNVPCNCYPPCDDVSYDIHTESTVPWFLGTNFKYGLVRYPRIRLKRDILFGFTDLLVQFGGTAGLCLGCSMLSFIEIVYFLTLRLFFFVRSQL